MIICFSNTILASYNFGWNWKVIDSPTTLASTLSSVQVSGDGVEVLIKSDNTVYYAKQSLY
jgi:hypothetical protein